MGLRHLIAVVAVIGCPTLAEAQPVPDAGVPVEPVPAQPEPEPVAQPEPEPVAQPEPEPEPVPPEATPGAAQADEPEASVEERLAATEDAIASMGQLDVSGFIQGQAHFSWVDFEDRDAGVPLGETPATNTDLFEIRRGRLKVTYDYEMLQFLLQLDANTTRVALRDAEATLHIPWTESLRTDLTVGVFKLPWGFELGYSDVDRYMPERSLIASRWFPSERDVGLRVRGRVADMFDYAFAVVNGQLLDETFFPGRDPNDEKDLVGRVGMVLDALSFGASGYLGWGFAQVADDEDTAEDESQDFTFSRRGMGLDVRYKMAIEGLGDMDLSAELAIGQNMDRRASVLPRYVSEDRNTFGFYASGSQRLGQYFGASLRVEMFEPSTDVENDSILRFGLALLLFPADHVRATFAFQYDATEGTDSMGEDNPDLQEAWIRLTVDF